MKIEKERKKSAAWWLQQNTKGERYQLLKVPNFKTVIVVGGHRTCLLILQSSITNCPRPFIMFTTD
jgi:hypothetical protein